MWTARLSSQGTLTCDISPAPGVRRGSLLHYDSSTPACSPPVTQGAQGLHDVELAQLESLQSLQSSSSLQVLCVLSMTLQAPVGACRILVMREQRTVRRASQSRGRKEGANSAGGLCSGVICLQPGSQEKVWAWSRRKSPRAVPLCPHHIFLSSLQLCLTNPALLHFVPQP